MGPNCPQVSAVCSTFSAWEPEADFPQQSRNQAAISKCLVEFTTAPTCHRPRHSKPGHHRYLVFSSRAAQRTQQPWIWRGTVTWGSGADMQVLQCCSCSFPRSNPESSFLPSRTSQATAVSRSTPEALHTARHGKEGIIQRFSQLLVPCESSQWAHWESEFVVIIIARKYFYFYESVTKPFPGLCSLFCMEKPLFKTRI